MGTYSFFMPYKFRYEGITYITKAIKMINKTLKIVNRNKLILLIFVFFISL